jgi:hypothetical protein
MSEPLLHPEWKQALKQLLELGLQPGDVVARDWLEELLELPEARNAQQWQARQLKWLQQFERLRDELLTTHQIWLRSNGAGGYEVVPPAKQTEMAYSEYSRAAFLKLKRMSRIAQNVKLSELTDSERRANSDALAKMSMLVGMVGGAMIEDKRVNDDKEES